MTALDAKRMQTFFNEFILSTYSFLNKFSSVSESKLINLERKLTRIEASIILIEEKLSDVSKGTASVNQQSTIPVQSISTNDKISESNEQVAVVNSSKSKESKNLEQTETPNQPPTQELQQESSSKPMIKISAVPLYRKYFMMLKVGVPMSAVQQKMASEGVDVDLSNPDRLVEDTFTDEQQQLESEEQ